MLDDSRIVRLAAPAGGLNGKYSLGSGFVIAPELVLTAEHVRRRPGADDVPASVGDSCEVSVATVAGA